MKVCLRFLSFMVVLVAESYVQALVQQAPLTAQEKLIITAEHRAAAKAQALALQQQSAQAKATQQAAQAQAKQVALQQAQEELAQRTVGNQAAKSKAINHVQFEKSVAAAGAVQIPAGQTLTGLWVSPVYQCCQAMVLWDNNMHHKCYTAYAELPIHTVHPNAFKAIQQALAVPNTILKITTSIAQTVFASQADEIDADAMGTNPYQGATFHLIFSVYSTESPSNVIATGVFSDIKDKNGHPITNFTGAVGKDVDLNCTFEHTNFGVQTSGSAYKTYGPYANDASGNVTFAIAGS